MRSMEKSHRTSRLPAAPGSQEHPCIALANTLYTTPGGEQCDLLRTPETATEWAHEHHIVNNSYELQAYCASRFISFRYVIKELFDAYLEQRAPYPGALHAVNKTAHEALTMNALAWDAENRRYTRRIEDPLTQEVDYAIARIAYDAITLLTGEEADKLSECEAPDCDRIMLRTHARRRWCSVRCGDRIRAARSYERKRAQAEGD